MKFKVGQTVEVVDRSGMSVPLKATAIVYRVSNEFLYVKWKSHLAQSSGAYYKSRFKPVVTKGQQLLFLFMEE